MAEKQKDSPHELRALAVRSHQTCISRAISAALGLPGRAWAAALEGLGLAPTPFSLSETRTVSLPVF